MNQPTGSVPSNRPRRDQCVASHVAAWSVLLAASLLLTGCFGFLKPARSVERYFVLTPLPASEAKPAGPKGPAVGFGRVKLPAYLSGSSLAVRRGTNEVEYLRSMLWAERLENGLQRVLVANLATLLPTDQIRLSAWSSQEVSAEVQVTIEQFDLDTSGRGVLVAWWRVLSPGGEKTLQAGQSRFSRQGPPPDTDPSAAVATLSGLVADFSRQLTEAVQQSIK